MRAVIGTTFTSLDDFRCLDVAMPEPGPGEVRLKVLAVGLGYVDGLIVTGRYQIRPAPPFTPGGEIVGTVDAVGAGVQGFRVGETVAAWTVGGGLADYCVVPAHGLRRGMEGIDPVTVAAMITNYATALHALRDRARLSAGESLLVLGAAGGVGTAAVGIGHLLGARVIAAASSAAKREFTQALGADLALDYTQPDWRETLRTMNGEGGVDVVFDPVGGATFEPAFRSLAWGGRHLVVGFAGGPIPALRANLALLKGASLVGVETRRFTEREPETAARNMDDLFSWVRDERLRVPVQATYTLDRFAEAMTAAMSGAVRGKIVVALG